MDDLVRLYPELQHYLELAPVGMVGILAGCASYCSDVENKARRIVKVVLSSSVLCIIVYAMLSATDLPYLARVGISAAIGYFGIDKALELVQKVLALKNNGGVSDKEKLSELKNRKKGASDD